MSIRNILLFNGDFGPGPGDSAVMYRTRTFPEWRDDMPRTFSITELPPHVPTVPHRRRLLAAAVLVPRLALLTARR